HSLPLPSFPTRRSSDLFLTQTRYHFSLRLSSNLASMPQAGTMETREGHTTAGIVTASQPPTGNRKGSVSGLRRLRPWQATGGVLDRKSTRLNSSHVKIS